MQECLAVGVRQLVLPFSTDQFANAADLERIGLGSVAAPNTTTVAELSDVIERALGRNRSAAITRLEAGALAEAVSVGVAARPPADQVA